MSGNGAYTAVEGEKVIMREGDLVLTPSWQWHDHGNETRETVVWMDGLDVPLTKALDCIFFQMHQNLKADHGKPVNGSKALFGHGHLAPTWVRERPRFSPLMLYSFDQTMEALDALRTTRARLRRYRARIHQPADRRTGHADNPGRIQLPCARGEAESAASQAARCSM
jgi:gentisate 1,2-dioxygenase